jgi:hypothetical protein
MRRWTLLGAFAVILMLVPAGLAAGGGQQTLGPYRVVTDAHGTCGNVWAVATARRTFSVDKRRDGSYRVILRDRGTFLTKAGRSPGSCALTGKHGSKVAGGRKGTLRGYVRGTVRGGTFDPHAACRRDCGTTEVWIATFFGDAARFSCVGHSRDCTFDYRYHAARGQGLRYLNWYDDGTGAGSFLKERFRGDIASRNQRRS